MLSNFEDWENTIGNFFASIGKKTYFLALGTIPVTGVGFIARKNTELQHGHVLAPKSLFSYGFNVNNLIIIQFHLYTSRRYSFYFGQSL